MGNKILLDWTRAFFLVMTLSFGLFGAGQVLGQDTQPTVTTDKSDYQPGDTVLITGSGWQPGEVVEMSIREIPTHHSNILISTTADAEGNISTKDFVTQQHHVGKSLFVTASGSQGSFAETHFTDASFTSRANGNWNNSTTWNCGAIPCASGIFPGPNDDVVITNAHTVTITANASAKTLQVSGASSGSINTILNVGTFSLNVTEHINLTSSHTNRQAILNVDGGTVNVDIINLNTGTGGNPGNVAFNINTNSLLNLTDVINKTGNSSRFNAHATSTVNFNGTSPQVINLSTNPASLTLPGFGYGNIKVNNTSGVSLSENVTTSNVTGNITVETGNFDIASRLIGGNTGKTFQVNDGATLSLFGNWSNTVFTISLQDNSTVDYYGAAQGVGAVSYGNLITSGSGNKTLTGATTVKGNLSIGSSTTMVAGVNGVTLKGDFSNNGTFNAGTGTVTFDGSVGNQSVTGGVTTFNNLIINKSAGDLVWGNNSIVNGDLTLASGKISTGSNEIRVNGAITGGGSSSFIIGNLRRFIPIGGTIFNFPIGTATGYTPALVAFTNVTTGGTLLGKSVDGDHPSIASANLDQDKSVNRHWDFINSGLAFDSYDLTTTFLNSDLDASSDFNSFIVGKYDGSTWIYPTVGAKTATSTQATGLDAFSQFQIAQGAKAPVVNDQPENATVCEGQTASFTSTAFGPPPPSVQWQVSMDNGASWSNIGGATNTTYSFTASVAQDNNQYRAVFTNNKGTTNSDAANLTVNTAPLIGTEPSSQSITYGDNTSFSVSATGTGPLSYQWQVDTGSGFANISDGGVYSGTNTSTLSLTKPTVAMSDYKYRVVVTNSCGTATSNGNATLTVSPMQITGNFTADNKVYDGSNSATVLTRTLNGVISPDAVTLTGGTATFSDEDVANGKTVTLTGATLSGADAGNYSLGSVATTTANITALEITGNFTADNKVYDGSNSATVLTRTLNGVISPDVVELAGGTATFSDEDVANGKTVTLTGATLSGADAGNYSLGSVATTTANITALEITGNFTAGNKIYDANTSATVLTRTLNGVISPDVVSLAGGTATFSDKNVANGKTVTLTGATLAGADAGNYTLSSVSTTTANITQAAVVVSITADNKQYDATTAATVAVSGISGILLTDVVTASATNGEFDNKNVGTGKTVTADIATSGADAGNYSFNATATDLADITQAAVVVSITADNKQYDATTAATVAVSGISGILLTDVVTASATNGEFDNKNVGTGKTVTADIATSGADAGNYSFNATATDLADITQAAVVVSITADNKQYDATTAATVAVSGISGILLTDVVTASATNGEFDNKNVGTGKTVTADIATSGADAGNYSFNATATDLADITQAAVVVSITADNKQYDATTAATVAVSGISGILLTDVVTASATNGEFDNKNVGTGKTVTADIATSGADAGNYSFNATATDLADITQAAVVVSITADNKQYDATTAATVAVSGISGILLTDVVTASATNGEFDNKNVGTGKTVTADIATSGADAGNYSFNATATDLADITQAAVVVSITADNKQYDATTAATVAVSGISGILLTDVVTASATNGEFDNKNVGTGKTVTADIATSGADAGNYSFNATATDLADITQAAVVVSITADNKQYDATTAATVAVSGISGILLTDVVTASATNGEFDNKNVGTGKTVTADIATSGADAGNYSFNATATDLADITQAAVVVSITADNKQYDATTAATVAVSGISGILLTDVVTASATNGEFDNKNVGTGKTVTADIATSGADAGNYSFNATATDLADITQAAVVVSITADNKQYDATTAATVAVSGISGILLTDVVTASATNGEFDNKNVGTGKTVTADIATSGADAGNYSFNNSASTTANITPAPTSISVDNSLADCDGDLVTLTATVNTDNSAIQSDVDDFGGTVTFKNGSDVLGVVIATSVSGGVFSDSFVINLPLGATYNISAEFVPNSGNLTGSQTTAMAELGVLQVFISSSVAPNTNGNVVIFDGAASSLGLPSSTTLTARYQPTSYFGVTYKWYVRNVGGSFSLILGATNASYQVIASDDFVREYMVELSIGGQCIANTIFSKVVSVEASCGKEGQNKVQVCHVTPNGRRRTICVSANAVNALLSGSPGSYIGSCNISYRTEQDPELITVPWNTPVELIKIEIVKQSEKWFNRKKININISTEAYNGLQPGMYTLTAELEANDFYELKAPIAINVLVLDKPLAQDITISNDQLAKDLRSGQVVGTLSTIDPIDNIHTYSLAENEQVELNGDQLIWKGSSVPATVTVQVMSTDRAGQTISRVITLRKELKPGEFFMYPNPATSETNIMLDLDESATVAFQVYDAIGRLVIQDEVYKEGSFTHTIKVDGLAPGMYTVQLKVGNMVMTKRLIKK
jgi:hypothetical protein